MSEIKQITIEGYCAEKLLDLSEEQIDTFAFRGKPNIDTGGE
jgi:hypothetical protein